MRTNCFALALSFALLSFISFSQEVVESIMIDDKEYTKVKVQRIENDSILLLHSKGLTRIRIDSLSAQQLRALGLSAANVRDQHYEKILKHFDMQIVDFLMYPDDMWSPYGKISTVTPERDDLQAVTWYKTIRYTEYVKNYYETAHVKTAIPRTVLKIELYVAKHDTGNINLRILTHYSDFGENAKWLFYDTIYLLGDNNERLELNCWNKKSDVGKHGSIREWSDNYINAKHIRGFMGANNIQVRFSGKYSCTFQMTLEQLQAFKEVYIFYDELQKFNEQAHIQFVTGKEYFLQGTEKDDFKEAFRLWLAAAEKGSAPAQYVIGLLFENGNDYIELEKDLVASYMWYSLAATSGISGANERLPPLRKTMTTDDIEKGIKRVERFIIDSREDK